MDDLSRRGFLTAGGALGAMGVLTAMGLGAPPAWGWSPQGSVVGSGDGADPHWVWDDEADPLVARLIEDGEVPGVNATLRSWRYNGQEVPEGLPADLRDFLQRHRELPAWADRDLLEVGAQFTKTHGFWLGTLYGLGSGMMSTAIPREARAVYWSRGGAYLKDRIAKTSKLGYDIGHLRAYQPDGEMVVTALKTRLVHAGVRHLLPQSLHWQETATQESPISQADMMVTWHSLPTFVRHTMQLWGVPISDEQDAGFLHLWQVSAHMLGILDEYIPATWQDARDQSAEVLGPVLGPTPEGIDLADRLLDLPKEYDQGASRPLLASFTRYTVGDDLCDQMQIERYPEWEAAIRFAWPRYVAYRSGMMAAPLVPEVAWVLDEMIRQGVLAMLSDFKPINIEIPETNRSEGA